MNMSIRFHARGRRSTALAAAGLFVGLFSTCLPYAARAEDTAGERQPNGKFADQVRQDRGRAQYVRQEYGDVVEGARYGGLFEDIVKEDLALAKKDFDAEAALFDRAADAWDAGDQVKAQQLRTEADAATKVKNLWRQRLLDWRRRQGEAAPTERWYRDVLTWVRPDVKPVVDDFARAKRAAADAWGRLAEATVPGADPAVLADLREKAYAADAEREIADWRFKWAHERNMMLPDPKVTGDELTQADEALRQLHEARARLRREEIDRDRRGRELEEKMRAADARLRKAYEAAEREAREAKIRAEQEKKK